MSVRAYKIIKTAKKPTFNLWHDEKFMELFEEVIGFEGIDASGGGHFEIGEESLYEIKEHFKEKSKDWTKEEVKRTKEIIKQIEKDVKKSGYASYLAY